MKRNSLPASRDLHPVPLDNLGGRVMTMSVGQWDHLLVSAYDQGWTLLELDDDERPVRAYRKTREESE